MAKTPVTKKKPLSASARLSYFLHQDKMMWSRLQTLMTVQAASIAAAFAIRVHVAASMTAVVVGIVLSILIVLLFQRDRQYRDHHGDILASEHADDEIHLRRIGWIPRGRDVFWFFIIIFGLTDVTLMIAVGHKWIV